MGKNRNQKNSQKPQIQLQVVEQEPFLKGLQRKVRNLNKKLGTIQDLEKKSKADLHPQQVNKIEQKQDVLYQINRYKDFITIYQQVHQESKDAIKENDRKNRNNLLKQVATLLVVWKFGYVSEGQDKTNIEIIELLNHFSGEYILGGMHQKISQALANYFDCQTEKKKIQSYKTLNFQKVYQETQQSKKRAQQQQQLRSLKQAIEQYEQKLEAGKAEKQALAAQFHQNQTQMQSTIEASNKRDEEQQKKIQDLMETIKTLKQANAPCPKSSSQSSLALKEVGKNKSIHKEVAPVQTNAEENNTDVQSSSSESKNNSPQMSKQTSEKPTNNETATDKNTNTNGTEAIKDGTSISQNIPLAVSENVIPVASENVPSVTKQIKKTETKSEVEAKEKSNNQPNNKNKKKKGKKHYKQKNEREEEKPETQNKLVVSPRKSPKKPKVKYIRADKYAERLANEAKIAAEKQATEKEEVAKREAAEKEAAKKDGQPTDSKQGKKSGKGKKTASQQAAKPQEKPHKKLKYYNKNYNNNHPKNHQDYGNHYRNNNYCGYKNYYNIDIQYLKNHSKLNCQYESIFFTKQQVEELKNDGFKFVGVPNILRIENVEAQPTKPNKKHYVEKKIDF